MADPVSTGALALGALHAIGKIMDFFPNYDKRKRNEFKKLVREYERQKFLPYDDPDYSDDVLLNLRIELHGHVQQIQSYIQSESKKS